MLVVPIGIWEAVVDNHYFVFLSYSFFFWQHRILVPQPGFKTGSPTVEAQSLNRLTTREVPIMIILNNRYTLLDVINKDLLHSTGNSTQHSVRTYEGKELKRVDICKCITDSLGCTPSVHTK